MVIGFIAFFDATRDYILTDQCYTHSILSHGLDQSLGNGFQRRVFAFFCDSDLSPCLSCRNSPLTDPPTNSQKQQRLPPPPPPLHNYSSSLYSLGTYCSENTTSNTSSSVACLHCVAMAMVLWHIYRAVVSFLVPWSLPRNRCVCHNI
jgi:hypothetical protein